MPNSVRRQLIAWGAALWAQSGQVFAHAADSEPPKFGLVIGNANYLGHGRSLANPERDAALISSSLKSLGFEVTQCLNLSRKRMQEAVADFADRLPDGSTSFVFYAGHGMQIGGANYLVPVDMQPNSEQSVQLTNYPLKSLLERLALSKSAINIVALDACRNNPFQPEVLVRLRSLTQREGLAAVKAPRGTLVAYATAPGQLAADGKNSANSLYATTLAKALLDKGLSVEQVFKRVGHLVRNETNDNQIPWFESSLSDDFYLQRK